MHLTFRNVNDAFNELVCGIYRGSDRTLPRGSGDLVIPTTRKPSRAGDTLQVDEPVIVTYQKPRERVLFNAARDANPFFHLFESLWMLAGKNDVAPLQFYSSGIADIASDDGKTFNGAYGYRWRYAKELFYGMDTDTEYYRNSYDQLDVLIKHLIAKPESRRAVLQMWNVEDDLKKIDKTKDVCCNTAVMFSIRRELHKSPDITLDVPVLDMTVTNRSNDMIWGMLGANVVHFSFLQEYIACAIGAEVGRYHQFTNNLHVYLSNWKPKEWLTDARHNYGYKATYGSGDTATYQAPLFHDRTRFDAECERIVENYETAIDDCEDNYSQPFIRWVCLPMFRAFSAWKTMKNGDMALSYMREVYSADWQRAGTEWIQRRIERKMAKNAKGGSNNQ